MIAITQRSLRARKRWLITSLLVVGLGVVFQAGTRLLSDTLRANFDRLFTQANGCSDVVLRGATKVGTESGPGARTGVDAGLLQRVHCRRHHHLRHARRLRAVHVHRDDRCTPRGRTWPGSKVPARPR